MKLLLLLLFIIVDMLSAKEITRTGKFLETFNENDFCYMKFEVNFPREGTEFVTAGCPEEDISMFNENKHREFIIRYDHRRVLSNSGDKKEYHPAAYTGASFVNPDLDLSASYLINKQTVNAHRLPDTNSEIISKYMKYSDIDIVGQSGDWVKISLWKNNSLTEGWILSKHVSKDISTWQSYYLAILSVIIIIVLTYGYFDNLVADGRYSSGYKPVDMSTPIIFSFVIYMIFYTFLWIISYIFSIEWIGIDTDSFFNGAYQSFFIGIIQLIHWFF